MEPLESVKLTDEQIDVLCKIMQSIEFTSFRDKTVGVTFRSQIEYDSAKKLLDKSHDVGILNGNINYEIIIPI